MKNKFILFSALALWALSSCTKEQVPSGLILKDQNYIIDSLPSIASIIPASQTKQILVEEATGVRCTNCPAGAKILRDLKTQYPGKILSVSVYSTLLNQYEPPAKYDFNSTDANDLVAFIEGKDPAKPFAAIDRLTGSVEYTYFFKANNWASKIAEIKDKTTPLNIELTSTPTGKTDEYLISTKTIFTEDWSGDIALSLYLLEDHVKDYQDSGFVKIPDYEHNHILRKVITPIPGSTFKNATTTKEKGRVYEKFVTFTIPTIPTTTIKKENCHILAFIHKTGTDKEIIHAQEIELE